MDEPDFSQVDAFLRYLQFEKRYSAHTVRAYADDLRDFFIWLEGCFGTLPVGEISSAMVRSWLAENRNRGLSVKSINRKISSLKSFFKYLLMTGVLQKNADDKCTVTEDPEKASGLRTGERDRKTGYSLRRI